MAKLTRKSYRRKKIAFAAVILGGVALVSSGFAAFVLSQDKTGDGTGSIEVGEVSDGALEMTITSKIKGNENDAQYPGGWKEGNPAGTAAGEKDTFRFDAQYGDMTGRAKWNGTDYEHLEIQYTVTIFSATESFDRLTIQMAQNAWVDDQVGKNNIVAPSCYKTDASSSSKAGDSNLKITVNKTEPSESNGNRHQWTAVYSVAFKWGSTFDSLNPTEYYDKTYGDSTNENPKGSAISYNDMKATIGGLFNASIDPFKITFTAYAK